MGQIKAYFYGVCK